MKHRISERSFVLQTRITTLVSVIVGGLIALLVFQGMTRAAWKITGRPQPPKPPVVKPIEKPETRPPDTAPEPELPIPASSEPAPEAAPPPPKTEAAPGELSYLQLHALTDFDAAWAQRAHWERRLGRAVWVAHESAGVGPYKVLVGPFPDRRSASAYKRQKKLDGFPRALEPLRLYAR